MRLSHLLQRLGRVVGGAGVVTELNVLRRVLLVVGFPVGYVGGNSGALARRRAEETVQAAARAGVSIRVVRVEVAARHLITRSRFSRASPATRYWRTPPPSIHCPALSLARSRSDRFSSSRASEHARQQRTETRPWLSLSHGTASWTR